LDQADEEEALDKIMLLAERDRSAAGEAARRILEETAVHIGVAVANLINLLNPERVIIGGWAGLAMAPVLLPSIREIARDHALRLPFSQTSIEQGTLGPDAVARGAATLPVARFLDFGGEPPGLPLHVTPGTRRTSAASH
jgi:predicted NBD/HSP70 family sugar kinase